VANLVTVRKWGNSLGVRLPKAFATERSIADGDTISLDDLKVVAPARRRRSRYQLKDVLQNYVRPPRDCDVAPAGKEQT
jgi:antitoxin component of MazEF toxin-antitoxin module